MPDSSHTPPWPRWAALLEGSGPGTCQKPSSGHVYLVAQTLYKLVPEFDEALVAILQRDSQAILALRTGHPQPQIHRRIASRIAVQLKPAQLARLCFVPMQNASTYFWMLKHANVVLDTFPHGGHTTTLDAFSAGVPVVSLRSGHLAGGFAAGFLEAVLGDTNIADNVRDCCLATTISGYVQKAMLLASHSNFHAQAQGQVLPRFCLSKRAVTTGLGSTHALHVRWLCG